ncbi:MAG: hypothetical protein A2X25_07040 [Chloroflexi bacterium GWB2_49_20]|nr:MAG: hypothetical protein A2X25_07040 [Chloroflexi bacterium GWB2_49_20]OGN77349.1 MAG: hypothetical protein A2X26_07755 [Chloroflexi bacterium GWC2_49_37]OGN84679.1 MAG: hypothetical protein A2X27_12975 [Chloroflexi bacterium GWD2_49_16]HBG74807.1 hypothetical protein [Anaerolineae bacterium]HCM96357.1 hypothetical protein [Anaerolineae bacterium]
MNEMEAQKLIKHMDGELETFSQAYEEGRWLKNQGLLSASDQFDLEVRRTNILLNKEIQDIVNEFLNTAENPVFRRVLLVLDRLIKDARVESNPSVYKLRSKIEQAIVNYPITIAGRKASRTDIRQILRTEKDIELRQEAFHCFDKLSELVEKDVKELVHRRNHIAQEMGYAHFGDLGLMLQGLSRTQLNEWFGSIIQKTDSTYQSFLSESAERLHQSNLYPQDLLFAVTQFKSLPDEYFTTTKLTKSIQWLADRIKLTEALARVRIDFVDIPFQGICVTIHVPDDIRILINPSNGQSYYSTFFHEIGHAMHSSFITQPYHLFRDEPGPFCEGMAETMARFVDDPEWLLNSANLPEEIAKQNKSIWRTSTVVHMRTLISQAEFEWRMYAEPEADFLNVFQTIKADYLKMPSDATLAWADNSYWTSYPFYVQNYVVAEMIASQTHLALRKFLGHTITAESGAWLAQNYWNSGGSIEWSEKILRSTGAILSPDELILELTKGYPPE